MSSEVQGYLDDLEEIFRGIPTESEAVAPSNALNDSISEAEDTLNMLRVAISSVPESQRAAVQQQLRAYTERLQSVKRRLLFGGDSGGGAADDRSLTEEERHEANMARLYEASRQLAQNEETALNIRQQLAQQRDVLERATGNARTINNEMTTSSKLLTSMSKWWRG